MAARPARSHGRIRGSGVSMVPNRIRSVTIAAAVSVTQASWPHTASQVKIASHPAASAATARSANSRELAALITIPVCRFVMAGRVSQASDSALKSRRRTAAQSASLIASSVRYRFGSVSRRGSVR